MSARKRRVWESQYCSAILSSAKVEITPQTQGQVSSSPLGKSQSGHPKYTTHRIEEDTWFSGVFLEVAMLSTSSKCRSYTIGVRSPFLMNLWHSLRTPFVFQSVLNGQLPSLVRKMVSLDFVIIQLTGLDESKNVSKSSIFSKLFLEATLEKYSYLVKSSFILLLD